MSGHAATGAFRLQEQPQNNDTQGKSDAQSMDPLDGYIKSLELVSPGAAAPFTRPRKLSQEDLGVKNNTQKLSTSKLPNNLSEEANGSNKGGTKSVFSDSISNPDLDEYLFNKQTPAGGQ